ncbi:MAG TPA: 4a-hydroxytetrahydrobiopterin dehydratase [Candidatus Acidoferrales bacterium]|nr:4a-hydroxytetrahydrobiopterin dehydratase [Candidatus Acidoferrales bacterium]
MKTHPLTHAEIAERLRSVPGWHHVGNAIERVFDQGDFNGSLHFVNAVGEVANRANHHPDITIQWNRVTLTLTSHDAGGLTGRDFDLAKTIDALADPG